MTDTLNQEMSRTERRRFILRGLTRALILSVILILLYFLGPLDRIDAVPVWVILVVAPLILLAVSVWQIRAILRSDQPGLRGIEALSIVAPLYLILFAATYFLMARADPRASPPRASPASTPCTSPRRSSRRSASVTSARRPSWRASSP